MNDAPLLPGRRILVVEDEYVIARDIAEALEREGAKVLGPVGTLEAAMARLAENEDVSGAVLDIKVYGKQIYPIAETLRRRGIPFIFATGYDLEEIASAFKDVPHCEKPVDMRVIVAKLAQELARRPSGPIVTGPA